MDILVAIAVVVGSYLLGAVPFGVLFTRLFADVDVRSVGSGNIGATNVLRAAGKKAAVLTLLADCAKGLLPALAVRFWLQDDALAAAAGGAAVLGHNFPVYLAFKGGKGVATGYGAMLAMTPQIALVCLLVWVGAAYLWRYSSLSALVSYALYPVLVLWLRPDERALGALAAGLAGLIYYRHRENIRRLLTGDEPKIGQKKA